VETVQQQQQQRTKLFIIPGISEEVGGGFCALSHAHVLPNAQTGFAPQTRKEISSIAWHWVSDLPSSGSGQHAPECACGADACVLHRGAHCRQGQLKYYMVHPFVGPLRRVRNSPCRRLLTTH